MLNFKYKYAIVFVVIIFFAAICCVCEASDKNSIELPNQANVIDNGQNLSDKYIFTPDIFNGSDDEKIQQSLNALSDEGGTLCLNRNYYLNKDIYIPLNSNNHRNITVQGLGKGNVIYTNGHKFTAVGDNRHNLILMGGVQFCNVRFIGIGNDLCFDMDALIRLRFQQCYFYNYRIVFNSDTELVQDLVCSMCTFRGINDYVLKSMKQTFHSIFSQCTVEASAKFCYLGKYTAGFRVIDCCIEGLSGSVAKIDGCVMGITFERNYFEQNATDSKTFAWMIFRDVTECRSLTIEDNIFSGINQSNINIPIVMLPKNRLERGVISVTNNALNDCTNITTPLFDANPSRLVKVLKVSANSFNTFF